MERRSLLWWNMCWGNSVLHMNMVMFSYWPGMFGYSVTGIPFRPQQYMAKHYPNVGPLRCGGSEGREGGEFGCRSLYIYILRCWAGYAAQGVAYNIAVLMPGLILRFQNSLSIFSLVYILNSIVSSLSSSCSYYFVLFHKYV